MSQYSNNEQLNNRRQEQRRRNRIRRIRNAIFGFFALWLIVSFAVLVYILVQLHSLQVQIDEIAIKKEEERIAAEAIQAEIESASIADANEMLAPIEIYEEEEAEEETNVSPEAGLADSFKVYLTFDDGPSQNTDKVLDVLDDYGVKATFFVLGRTDEESIRRYKRIVDEGHTIAMHSYSHSYNSIYSSVDALAQDISDIHEAIYDATGVDTNIYRFPGGSSNNMSGNMEEYISYVKGQGIRYFDWNVSSGDASPTQLSPDTIVENIMKDVLKYKTSVVLMHDAQGKDTTVTALPMIIEKLRGQGAVLLPISDDTALVQHRTV